MRVYKRGNTWTYAFDIKVDGKRKTVTKGGFRLKSEAESAGVLAQSDSKKGVKVYKTTKMTYNAFLDKWLYEMYRATVKENTFKKTISTLNVHIRPVIGDFNVTDITSIDIDKLLNDMVDAGKGIHVIKGVQRVLSKSFNDMVTKYNYIQYSPAYKSSFSLKKVKKNPKSKTNFVLSKEQIETIRRFLLKKESYYTFRVIFEIGLRCGLRIGEITGLVWDDIDFDNKKISIKRQLQRSDMYGVMTDSPKADSSGEISIDDDTVAMLRQYKKWQNEQFLKRGISKGNIVYSFEFRDFFSYNFVILNSKLEIFTTENQNYFNRIIRSECNISLFSTHCLRRTHATMLIGANAPIKAVQKRLRHKDIKQTLNTYTSLNNDMNTALNNIIEKGLFANSETCKQIANK